MTNNALVNSTKPKSNIIIKDNNSHSESKEVSTFSLKVVDAVTVGNHTAYRLYVCISLFNFCFILIFFTSSLLLIFQLTTNNSNYAHFPFAKPDDESRCFE